ncbi:MAG: 5'/3'-nucleotidase SurE [Gammaproteobacteria bacterium]|jgi:5'-nucleotidase|uniref:5'-nucleotidase SurE n=1 Tax=SAR86 cluster bacterium SAR86B TaxID=1123867 RepID=J5KH51_9GAMM|nr:MAG: 5'-nucleotidase SurE [SAR86 cluster bacterium SAR86B]
MKILLTNDDGYDAVNIKKFFKYLSKEHDVWMVAPKNNCSGMSSAISFLKETKIEKISDRIYAVDGTPADCVYFGMLSIIEDGVDMVVSGINHGANIGTDVIYSGTVGAAAGGRGLKYPPLAISAETYEVKDLDYICRKSCEFVNKFSKDKNKFLGNLVNINFPDLIESDVNGVRATSLAQRGVPQKPIVNGDYYRYNFSGIPMKSSDSLTDAQALSDGYISVSLLDYSFGATNNIDQIKDII